MSNSTSSRLFVAIARILPGLAFLALIGAWISQFAGGSFVGFGQQHLYNDAMALALIGIGCFLDAHWHAKESS